jgi:hypothetical protein
VYSVAKSNWNVVPEGMPCEGETPDNMQCPGYAHGTGGETSRAVETTVRRLDRK